MPHPAHWLAEAELLRLARDRGRPVSPEQLRRWQKRWLAPRGVKLGRGRGIGGSDVRYPPEAVLPLVHLADALRLTPRDLDDAGWKLWVMGYPVTVFASRLLLRQFARTRERARQRLATWHDDDAPFRDVWLASSGAAPLRRAARAGRVKPLARDAVGHLGQMFAAYTSRLALRPHEVNALATLVSGETHTVVTPDAIADRLRSLLALNRSVDWLPRVQRVLAGSPDEALERWRDDATALWTVIRTARPALPIVMPWDFFRDVVRVREEDRKLRRMMDAARHGSTWRQWAQSPLQFTLGEDYERVVDVLRPLLTPRVRRGAANLRTTS